MIAMRPTSVIHSVCAVCTMRAKSFAGWTASTKGSEGDDDRSMPRPHTRLDGHDDRHTTHGEGDACHGEGKVARSLEGEEREVEVAEVPDPDEERQEEEAPRDVAYI